MKIVKNIPYIKAEKQNGKAQRAKLLLLSLKAYSPEGIVCTNKRESSLVITVAKQLGLVVEAQLIPQGWTVWRRGKRKGKPSQAMRRIKQSVDAALFTPIKEKKRYANIRSGYRTMNKAQREVYKQHKEQAQRLAVAC